MIVDGAPVPRSEQHTVGHQKSLQMLRNVKEIKSASLQLQCVPLSHHWVAQRQL